MIRLETLIQLNFSIRAFRAYPLIVLLTLDKQFPVEQFEATVLQYLSQQYPPPLVTRPSHLGAAGGLTQGMRGRMVEGGRADGEGL